MGTASFLFCVALVGQNAPPASPFETSPPARQPAVVAPADGSTSASAGAPAGDASPPATTVPPRDRYERYRSAPSVAPSGSVAPSTGSAPPPVMPVERAAPVAAPAASGASPSQTWTAPARDPRQPPAAATAPHARSAPADSYQPPVDATPPPQSEAAALMAETLSPPSEGALPGQSLTLVQVLTMLRDRGQQLRATQAYWQLSAAMADNYHRLGEYRLLDEIASSETLAQGSESDTLAIHAALARAKADAHAAELAAITAQHELASLVPIDTRAGLPLAGDAPHVGTYRTQFDTIFASAPAPAQAYLTDRLLPIQLEEIRQRAIAVQASTDALDAAIDAWSKSAASPRSVIDSLAALRVQREAFIAGVERYNQEIANYALGIAPLGTGSRELTSMLIKLDDVASNPRLVPQADAAFSAPAEMAPLDPGVVPAGFDQPLRNEPTPADPRRFNQNASAPPATTAPAGEPTLAEPGLLPRSDDPNDQPRPLRPLTEQAAPVAPASGAMGPQFEMEIPHADEALTPEEEDESQPKPAREHSAGGSSVPAEDVIAQLVPVRRLAYYAPAVAPTDEGLATSYHELLSATPAKRAQRLASLLHWDRSPELQPGASQPTFLPVTLPELLAAVGPGSRRPAIDAYWVARENAARMQRIAEEIGQYDVLAASVLDRRGEATGPLDMLRLRAAKEAATADLLAARGALLVSEFQLTTVAGRSPAETWLRPVTVPHAGGYRLKIESQAVAAADHATIRRLAETVPGLHTVFTDRAAAVVMADEARATAIHDYQLGAGSIDDVLAAIAEETHETETFLSTLTGYNQAIAEYVMTVLPLETPPAKLAGALVLTESGRSPRDTVARSTAGA